MFCLHLLWNSVERMYYIHYKMHTKFPDGFAYKVRICFLNSGCEEKCLFCKWWLPLWTFLCKCRTGFGVLCARNDLDICAWYIKLIIFSCLHYHAKCFGVVVQQIVYAVVAKYQTLHMEQCNQLIYTLSMVLRKQSNRSLQVFPIDFCRQPSPIHQFATLQNDTGQTFIWLIFLRM